MIGDLLRGPDNIDDIIPDHLSQGLATAKLGKPREGCGFAVGGEIFRCLAPKFWAIPD